MLSHPVRKFRGPFDFLSNFFPCKFVWEDIEWPSSEHAYQAAKRPRSEWPQFLTMTAGQAKRSGGHGDAEWAKIKVEVMLSILRAKFEQNPLLKERLLGTGDALIEEGNEWGDRFWGISPVGSGQGRNELGKLLMSLRKEFGGHGQVEEKQVIISYDHAPKNNLP